VGLDWNGLNFLAEARKGGVNFDRTITLGRQNQYVSAYAVQQIFDASGLPLRSPGDHKGYSETLFRELGASVVDSTDNSGYEQATIVADLNDPFPEHLFESYDAVFDGGTMEHVFNFPQALKNAMSLPKLGGTLFIHTMLNNWAGHGFYQFSPELFHRTLNRENGYQIVRMIAHPHYAGAPRFECPDPEQLRGRLEFAGSWDGLMLFVEARREQIVPLFRKTPQQSDYAAQWTGQTVPLPRPNLNQLITEKLKRIPGALHLKRALASAFPAVVRSANARAHRRERRRFAIDRLKKV
jgi:hypothetical protein